MSLQFNLMTNQGETSMTSQELLQQYGEAMGLQPVGLSQDGASGIYQTPQGLQTIPFHEALGNIGIQIEAFEPTNSIQAEKLGTYRMAMESISDPDIQQAYLKTVAQKDFGIEQPLIVNKGSQAFLWAPDKGSWVALTDSPGLDRGDVLSGASSLAKGALTVGGGFLGGAGAGLVTAPTGPGAVAGTIAGVGLGSATASALGDEAQAGIMAGLDPNYREAYGSLSNYAQKEGSNIAKNAAIAGVAGGAMGGLGKVLPGLAAARPSQILQGAGNMTRGAGQMTSAIGKGLGTDVGRMGMQMGLDPTGISGVGALGGLARDVAAPIAQGTAKTAQFARDTIAGLRGFEGPLRPMAGQTFAETAQYMPQVGNLVRGIEAVGGGIEKVGRGVENALIGTTKGVGATLQGTGRMAQLAGKGLQYAEAPAVQAGARSMGQQQQQPQFQGALDRGPYIQASMQQNPMGYQVANNGSQSLIDAIVARGGFNVL